MIAAPCAWARRLAIASCLFGPLCFGLLAAQEADSLWRLGIRAVGGVALQRTTLIQVPGHNPLPPGTPAFSADGGFEAGIQAQASIPLSQTWQLRLACGISHFSGSLLSAEQTNFSIDGVDTPGTINHSLDASLNSLLLAPSIQWRLASRLWLSAGPTVGFVLSSDYELAQTIVSPPGQVFELSGSNSVITGSGSLPGVHSVIPALNIGLIYDLPLDREASMLLRPELRYRQPFTTLAADIDWSVSSLSVGLAFEFSPRKEPIIVRDTLYRRDTTVRLLASVERETVSLLSHESQDSIVVSRNRLLSTTIISEEYIRIVPQPRPLLDVDMRARFVLDNNRETDNAVLKVDETIALDIVNLLPYVFFERQSADLADKYRRLIPDETQVFATASLRKKATLHIYYHILNIVGKRLKDNPDARLTLTSCNSDPGTLRQQRKLAEQRAATVIAYLHQTWRIEPQRISTVIKRLPDNPSPPGTAIGADENRRVELSSDDPRILAPLMIRDTSRQASPSVVRFIPDVLSEAGLASWQILVLRNDSTVHSFQGEEAIPDKVSWDINSSEELLSGGSAELHYYLRVRDQKGYADSSVSGKVRFEQIRKSPENGDKPPLRKIARFSLMSFDYNLFTLSDYHHSILDQVKSRVSETSELSIIGSTDVVGEEGHNLALSQKRAQTIADSLAIPAAHIEGIGEDPDTFPNQLPEGRFYSRRVDIIIRDEW